MTKEMTVEAFTRVRAATVDLCQNLATEDYVIQGMEDVSPPKWHLAHTSWFFETFILAKFITGYTPFNKYFNYLFNSYYQGINKPFPRANRGLLSRPTVAEVYEYRHHVNKHLIQLVNSINEEDYKALSNLISLGLHHEQQHQELLLMDIKYNFSLNPLYPSYALIDEKKSPPTKINFIEVEGGLVNVGFNGDQFSFDNERPSHKTYLNPYRLANRLITNKEYLEFIEDGGYQEPRFWLSDGWDLIQKEKWSAPLYWKNEDNEWQFFTLHGLEKINLEEPVSHLSFYEADAYANWANKRLPLEEEWEHFVTLNALTISESDNFMDSKLFHPQGAKVASSLQQFFGELWEWTASPYRPYPGFVSLPGVLGEYNGKFMANQMVLRGGSCVTPRAHMRKTYRNFFQPDKRWQFSGLRLAENI